MTPEDAADKDTLSRPIGDLAHDLRTPMAIIRTNAEVLLLEAAPDAPSRPLLEDIISEIDRASALLGEFLAAVRTEAGR